MFRTSRLYQLSICIVCFAAGAGSAWYFIRVTVPAPPPAPTPAPAQQNAAPVTHQLRTASWFEAHRAEMAAKLAECSDNPGGAMADPECVNADKARAHIAFTELRAGAPK